MHSGIFLSKTNVSGYYGRPVQFEVQQLRKKHNIAGFLLKSSFPQNAVYLSSMLGFGTYQLVCSILF